mmetsp:Transcript_130/g.427  ORF Transcript_130/g.427 Transcript_130/m.427 type:complete len:505 (+) Transcript_130:1226-2740(+)
MSTVSSIFCLGSAGPCATTCAFCAALRTASAVYPGRSTAIPAATRGPYLTTSHKSRIGSSWARTTPIRFVFRRDLVPFVHVALKLPFHLGLASMIRVAPAPAGATTTTTTTNSSSNNNNNKQGSASAKKEREGKGNANQRERGHRQTHERGRRGTGDGQLRAEPVRLTQQLHELVRGLLPTKEETERKARTVYFLQMMVGNAWKQAKIDIFGSAANSFGVRGSDIDISVDLPIEEDDRDAKVKVIETLGDMLQQVGMEKVVVLAHARVPLVKYVDPRTGCASDICINNRVAVANTKMLCDYARIDSRLRQLAFAVKHWARARKVNETYRGTLSSYAYVLMCIHLLQRRNPPVLPCLQGMRPTFSKLLQKGQDIVKCEYFDEVDKLARFGDNNRESVAELLFSFFEYWAWRHDYAHSVVSIRTGGFLSKAEKGWTKRIGNERHLICIEDPFETGHDLGRVVDRNSISALRDEFVRAAKILRDEEDPLPKLFEPYVRPDEQDPGEG